MSRPDEWVWGTLTRAQLAHAEAMARRLLQNVADLHLGQGRYAHTPDEWYQKLLGSEGEVAFRVLTGRPLPSIDELTSTWKGADADGYQVKTVSRAEYRLLFDDSDLERAHSLVLVLNVKPRFAIIGGIDVAAARAIRTWAAHLPHPAWMIEQGPLRSWRELTLGRLMPSASELRWS